MFDNETNVLQVLRSSPGHTFASTLYVSAACMAEDAATPAQLLDAVTAADLASAFQPGLPLAEVAAAANLMVGWGEGGANFFTNYFN